jgi:hypothetical protein
MEMGNQLCKDCPHLKSRQAGYITTIFWCGLVGDKIKCKKCRAYMDSPSTAVVRMLSKGIEQTRNEETMQKAKSELIILWNTRTPKERGGEK